MTSGAQLHSLTTNTDSALSVIYTILVYTSYTMSILQASLVPRSHAASRHLQYGKVGCSVLFPHHIVQQVHLWVFHILAWWDEQPKTPGSRSKQHSLWVQGDAHTHHHTDETEESTCPISLIRHCGYYFFHCLLFAWLPFEGSYYSRSAFISLETSMMAGWGMYEWDSDGC